MSRKILLVFLFLLSFSLLLILTITLAAQWSGILGIADLVEMLLSTALVFLVLAVVFYLKSQGSARQLLVFWIVAFGFMIGFPFTLLTSLALEVFLGVPRGSLFELLSVVGFGIGMILGYYYGKRETKEESGNLDSS